MILLLVGDGLRYNGKATAVGAQTERRGLAGPVSALLGGVNSPATFLPLLLLSLLLQPQHFLRFFAELFAWRRDLIRRLN
jgi:hypothetical protein